MSRAAPIDVNTRCCITESEGRLFLLGGHQEDDLLAIGTLLSNRVGDTGLDTDIGDRARQYTMITLELVVAF